MRYTVQSLAEMVSESEIVGTSVLTVGSLDIVDDKNEANTFSVHTYGRRGEEVTIHKNLSFTETVRFLAWLM